MGPGSLGGPGAVYLASGSIAVVVMRYHTYQLGIAGTLSWSFCVAL